MRVIIRDIVCVVLWVILARIEVLCVILARIKMACITVVDVLRTHTRKTVLLRFFPAGVILILILILSLSLHALF